jgi:hypothetical protein
VRKGENGGGGDTNCDVEVGKVSKELGDLQARRAGIGARGHCVERTGGK